MSASEHDPRGAGTAGAPSALCPTPGLRGPVPGRRPRQSRSRRTPGTGTTSAPWWSTSWPRGPASALSPGKGARARAVAGEGRLAGPRVVLAKPADVHERVRRARARAARLLQPAGRGPRRRPRRARHPVRRAAAQARRRRGRHNGLRSVTRSTGTKDYLRVRVGIGRPPGRQDPADFVLKDFSPSERKELDLLLAEAVDATEASAGARARGCAEPGSRPGLTPRVVMGALSDHVALRRHLKVAGRLYLG